MEKSKGFVKRISLPHDEQSKGLEVEVLVAGSFKTYISKITLIHSRTLRQPHEARLVVLYVILCAFAKTSTQTIHPLLFTTFGIQEQRAGAVHI